MAVRSIVLSCLMLLAISGCANKGPFSALHSSSNPEKQRVERQ
jgi:predicted small lipoprotein YifL